MKKLIILSMILGSIGISGCLDEIEVDTKDSLQLLTVDAQLFLGNGPHQIKIKKSAPFRGGFVGVEEPISGATVRLVNVDKSLIAVAVESSPGLYTNSSLLGIQGDHYRLEIDLDGQQYISKTELMPPLVPINAVKTSLSSEIVNNGSGNLVTRKSITVAIDSELPNKGKDIYLRYRLNGTYKYQEIASASNLDANICYIDEIIDYDNVNAVDGSEISDGVLKAWPIFVKEVDYKFAFDYCFKIEQQSITKEAFYFWKTIENEFARTGDIFETPPATLRGNIFNSVETRNDIVGLFSCIATYKVERHVPSIEAGTPRQQCLSFLRNNAESCFNCLLIDKSSYNKPSCFQ